MKFRYNELTLETFNPLCFLPCRPCPGAARRPTGGVCPERDAHRQRRHRNHRHDHPSPTTTTARGTTKATRTAPPAPRWSPTPPRRTCPTSPAARPYTYKGPTATAPAPPKSPAARRTRSSPPSALSAGTPGQNRRDPHPLQLDRGLVAQQDLRPRHGKLHVDRREHRHGEPVRADRRVQLHLGGLTRRRTAAPRTRSRT